MKAAYHFEKEFLKLPDHVKQLIIGAAQAYSENAGSRQLASLSHAMRVASNLCGMGQYSPQEVVKFVQKIHHAPVR